MDIRRISRHLFCGSWRVRRSFPESTMKKIEIAIRESELQHSGEIRFVVEGSLSPIEILSGVTARDRALELFSQLRVWDTEENNGVLIYVLLAEHRIELLADRSVDRLVGEDEWAAVCREIEAYFRDGRFEDGALAGVRTVTQRLASHFPPTGRDVNELPDTPEVV